MSGGAIPPGLEDALTRYLELRIAALEHDAAEVVAQRQRQDLRTEVGRRVTWLSLLVIYALILGWASQHALVASFQQPALLGQRLRSGLAAFGLAAGVVPEPLRGLVFGAFTAGVLLVFRSASQSGLSQLGGTLYAGLTVIALLGFSAAASTGFAGALAAAPGMVAAFVVILELPPLLRAYQQPGTVRWPRTLVAAVEAVRPARKGLAAAIFVGAPLLALAVAIAGAISAGGVLYWPTAISYGVFVAWCTWACAATPAAVRLSLWSMPAWAVLLLAQLTNSLVSYILAVTVALVVVISVLAAVLRDSVP